MKIAFILNSFPLVSETFILSQITGLLDRGHDLHVLAEKNPHEVIVHADFRKYSLEKRTTYFSVPKKSKFKMRFSLAFKLFYCLLSFPLKTSKSFFCLIREKGGFSYSGFNYAAHFFRRSYEIVHCHFGTIGRIGIILKKLGFCKYLVVTFYGYDVSSYVKKHGKDCYCELFKISDRLLVLSRDMKKRLIELGADEKKVQIHHLGTSPELFKYKERAYDPNRPIRILTVARLSEKKGLEYSIRAVSRLIHEYSLDIHYSVAGEGEMRNDLERLIVDLKVGDNIFLLGAKDQIGIRELYDQTDIFLLSSVTAENGDQEGTPTVLTEAICCGIPVVSTYHAGIPDIIIHGESGFLVPERDVDALVEKLEYLIKHPEIWTHMGRNGRKHFDNEFDVNILNRKLEDIYDLLLCSE